MQDVSDETLIRVITELSRDVDATYHELRDLRERYEHCQERYEQESAMLAEIMRRSGED